MKFEEYLKNHCGDVGSEFWKTWVEKTDTKLKIAIQSQYKGQRQRSTWVHEYCKGRVLFSGSWILFEYEEDSVLYAMKWL